MDEKPIVPPSPGAGAPGQAAKKPFQVKSLVLLIACGAAFFYAYISIREGMKSTAEQARLIRSGDLAERMDAARQLGEVKPEELQEADTLLIGALADQEERVRTMVAWSLGNNTLSAMKAEKKPLAQDSAQALLKTLADGKAEVKASAADAFERIVKGSKDETFPIEPKPVVSALVGLLGDESPVVRKNSGLAIAAFGESLSVEPPPTILEALSGAKLTDSRGQAALALGSFKKGVDPAVKALMLALNDGEPEVRSHAAVSLGKLDLAAAPALPALVALIDDPFVPPVIPPPPPSPFVATKAAGPPPGQPPKVDPATQAVKAIGQIVGAQSTKGDPTPPEVANGLMKALKSDREDLRDAATAAFQKVRKAASAIVPDLTRELASSLPEANSAFGPTAAKILGDVGPDSPKATDAIASLTSALEAKSHATRASAVTSLGKFGTAAAAAIPKLQEVAEGDKELAEAVKYTTDRLEGKPIPEAPRRKGRGGRGGGGGGGGGGGRAKGA